MFGLFKKCRFKNDVIGLIAIVEKLLSLQLISTHLRNTFPKLMTNKVAAGYVFGFYDACFRMHGLVNPVNSKDPLLLETSYKYIFGDQAGVVLLNSSIDWQMDREFQIGRQSGGEEYVGLKQKRTPPWGLARILGLGFNAEMVERTLDHPEQLMDPFKPRPEPISSSISTHTISS